MKTKPRKALPSLAWLGRWSAVFIIVCLVLTNVSSARAAVNDLYLISRSTLNEPGDKRSDRASVMSYLSSADPLERSTFASRATNLIDGAEDNDCFLFQGSELCFYDIFLHDENNLVTSKITGSTVPGLDGDSYYPTISDNGNYIVFQSAVEDLDTLTPPEDTETRETDIFLATLDANGNVTQIKRVSSAFIAEDEPNFDSGYTQYGVDGFNYYPITYNNGATRPDLYFPHPVASLFVSTEGDVYVVYESMASNLVDPDEIPPEPPNPPGPPPHLQPDYNGHVKDIFVRKMLPFASDNLLLTRGYDPVYGYYSGNPTDGNSYHAVFANGQRYVVFVSEATNLIPGFGPGDYEAHNPPFDSRGNVFWLDRDYDNDGLLDEFAQPETDPQGPGVRYYLVSHDNGPEQKPGNGLSKHPAASYNVTSEDIGGGVMQNFENLNIAFQSDASNLVSGDTNGFTDIFLYRWRRNMTTGEESEALERVSLPSAIQIPKGAVAQLPKPGPTRTLSGGQVPLEWGNAPTDVLLQKPGHLAWSNLQPQAVSKEAGTNEDEDPMCNLGGDPTQANLASYAPSISRDGRIVAFHSYASNLIDGDRNCACRYYYGSGIEGVLTKNCPDVYGRDWLAQQTWRMSVTQDGSEAQGDSVWGEFNRNAQFVYFSSFANLAGDDADGSYAYILQVFMRDQGNPPGNPNVQPTSWDFGNRHPFEYAEKTFRMLFLADLYVDQIALDPLSNSRFSIVNDNCSSTNPYHSGDTCTFKVAFQADAEMFFYTGQVNINLSDPNPGMPPTRTLNLALRANVTPWNLYLPSLQR